MREDPLPDADPNEKFYAGDNRYRASGQALEFKQLNIHAWEAFEKGQDVHLQAAPSQAELLFKNYKVIKEKLKSKMKDAIMEKYGNAATTEEIPKELLFGQTETEVEYDRAGRVIKGVCCKQTIRNSYCTGVAGIEAAESAANLMKANIDRKAASEETIAPTKEKRLATWGADIPEDLVLDQKKLGDALKKVTPEEMEAYRKKKVHHDDPMKDFVH
ncbi:hypothetical protein ACLB2K_040853 [Fragaria x ananassa]